MREPGFLLLAALAAVEFLFLSSGLIYPDPILNYPFPGGDTQDWIANGLFYIGQDVRYSARPPLLPLVLAGLHQAGVMEILPVLMLLLAQVTMLGLYRLLCLDYPRLLAWTITAVWMLNGSWKRLSLDLMADVPAACLLTWAVFFWRRTGGERPGYVLAGLFGGLSAVTQQAALLLPVPVLWTLLRYRRRDFGSRPFLIGAGLFLAPTCAWLLWKLMVVETRSDMVIHWSLVRPHLDSVLHYSFLYIAFVGVPAAAGILLGALSFFRRARREPWCAFVLSLQAVLLVFFVFFYDFNSFRFLAYLFPLSAVLLAEGLSRWRHPAAVAGMALLALLWALPVPGHRSERSRIVLWPAPLTYLKAAAAPPADSGSRTIDPTAFELEAHPASTILRHNVYRLVSRQRSRPLKSREIWPDAFREDLWGLYFYGDSERPDQRRDVIWRLGNLLGRRVHHLPASGFGRVWRRLDLTRLGAVDGKALYRARIPGRVGRWIVAVASGSAAEEEIRAALEGPRLPGPELAKAERVAAHLGNRLTVIFATSRGVEPWQAYLPFLVDAPQFFIVEPELESEARRMLGAGREVIRLDDVTLVEHQLLGWQWTAVEVGGRD